MKKLILPFAVVMSIFANAQTSPFGNTRYKGAIVENRMFQDC